MKKFLYFDMWSPEGHLVFNEVHLRALSEIGEVYTVFREGVYQYDLPHVIHYLDVPTGYYKEGENYYKSRIRLARMIRWVWRKVSEERWDYIILSSYDPLALFLSRRFKKAIVIDHNTIGLLDSPILGFPFRHLSKGIKHVVFNEYMKARLNKWGFNNVMVVPHGFIPMKIDKITIENETKIRQKYLLEPGDKIVFFPSLSLTTIDVIGEYIYNDEFNSFLNDYGLKLVTKSTVIRRSKSNIIIVEGYLPQEDYNYLFLHSSCNVLFYTSDFRYRTSGVLNECFANGVPCVFSDCEALKAYLPYINNKQCVFHNADELKKSIVSVLQSETQNYYINIEEIKSPLKAWSKIVKE